LVKKGTGKKICGKKGEKRVEKIRILCYKKI